jgi:polar amino acid transport system substrate-binding protein
VLKNKMFKGKKKISQVLLISLLLALSIVNFSHANTLKVCYDQWPPMTIFPSEDFPARGFAEFFKLVVASN